MAVLDGVPGLEVTVLVNGAPLDEYVDSDEETSPAEVIKYVEAVSGAVFHVKYDIGSAFTVKAEHGVQVELSLDGKWVTGHALERHRVKGSIFNGIREKVDSKFYLREMCFSELKIGESPTDVGLSEFGINSWT